MICAVRPMSYGGTLSFSTGFLSPCRNSADDAVDSSIRFERTSSFLSARRSNCVPFGANAREEKPNAGSAKDCSMYSTVRRRFVAELKILIAPASSAMNNKKFDEGDGSGSSTMATGRSRVALWPTSPSTFPATVQFPTNVAVERISSVEPRTMTRMQLLP